MSGHLKKIVQTIDYKAFYLETAKPHQCFCRDAVATQQRACHDGRLRTLTITCCQDAVIMRTLPI